MKSLKGQLLIASSQLLDPNFFQTVLLMVQHDENGALGLVLNRPTETPVDEAWRQVSDTPCLRSDPLNWGGPCQGVLMLLHADPEASEVEVVPGVHFTSDARKIEWLVRQEELPIRFYIGYAGWTAGQLEAEMETGSWLTAPADDQEIFHPAAEQWTRIKRQVTVNQLLGYAVDPRLLPPDPSLN